MEFFGQKGETVSDMHSQLTNVLIGPLDAAGHPVVVFCFCEPSQEKHQIRSWLKRAAPSTLPPKLVMFRSTEQPNWAQVLSHLQPDVILLLSSGELRYTAEFEASLATLLHSTHDALPHVSLFDYGSRGAASRPTSFLWHHLKKLSISEQASSSAYSAYGRCVKAQKDRRAFVRSGIITSHRSRKPAQS